MFTKNLGQFFWRGHNGEGFLDELSIKLLCPAKNPEKSNMV